MQSGAYSAGAKSQVAVWGSRHTAEAKDSAAALALPDAIACAAACAEAVPPVLPAWAPAPAVAPGPCKSSRPANSTLHQAAELGISSCVPELAFASAIAWALTMPLGAAVLPAWAPAPA